MIQPTEEPTRQVRRRRERANDYWGEADRWGNGAARKGVQPTKRMMRRRTEHADGTHTYRGNRL